MGLFSGLGDAISTAFKTATSNPIKAIEQYNPLSLGGKVASNVINGSGLRNIDPTGALGKVSNFAAAPYNYFSGEQSAQATQEALIRGTGPVLGAIDGDFTQFMPKSPPLVKTNNPSVHVSEAATIAQSNSLAAKDNSLLIFAGAALLLVLLRRK